MIAEIIAFCFSFAFRFYGYTTVYTQYAACIDFPIRKEWK